MFQNVAHKLDIKDAVESGVLVPVRCIRVKTNINLTDVRINGFKYNSMDLETTVVVPERNKLIVDTYLEYVKDKSTVIFCTSVDHADKIAELLRNNGVKAESVSGKTENSKRKQILKDYENKKIKVLCACDLLNEWLGQPHNRSFVYGKTYNVKNNILCSSSEEVCVSTKAKSFLRPLIL
ncbi:MAG: DEAD/DEAH box helicase [Ruminococcus sp.]